MQTLNLKSLKEVTDYQLLVLMIEEEDDPLTYQRLVFTFYQRYRALVVRRVSAMDIDADMAEEIFEESFLDLLRHAKDAKWELTAEPDHNVGGYLWTTARNKAIDLLRARKSEGEEPEEDVPDETGSEHDVLEQMYALIEELRNYEFSDFSIKVLKAVWLFGLTYNEASEEFGISISKIGQLVAAGRAIISRILDELE